MEENERLAVIETKIESIKKDIHTLYKKTEEINNLNTNMAILSNSMNELKATMTKYIEKIDNTSTEPAREKAKLWDTVIKNIIVGIIALGMGYLGTRFGINK